MPHPAHNDRLQQQLEDQRAVIVSLAGRLAALESRVDILRMELQQKADGVGSGKTTVMFEDLMK